MKALVLMILALFLIAGCKQQIISNQPPREMIMDIESGSKTLTYSEAKDIAENSECTEKGKLTENLFYNENTETWWIDMDMYPEFKRDICSPACVVDEKTLTAQINWRCMGALPPDQEETCTDNCGDGVCAEVVCMAIGCPCAETKENCPEDCK